MKGALCREALLSVVLWALFPAGALHADTPLSRWDRAKDPVAGDAWDLHVKENEVMAIAEMSSKSDSERERLLDTVRDVLESAHARTSQDLRLRFDLGEVYVDLEHYGEAIQVLAPALALAPEDDPATERAWSSLAQAYAKTDDSKDEIHAYERQLALTLSLGTRALALSNRAEAEMRLGHLDLAVEGYKDSLAVSESNAGTRNSFIDSVLAHWGLTVALDRSGDVTGSEREAAFAVSQNGLEIIRLDNVFFVPDYEIFYYIGLGRMALAKQAASPMTSRPARELARHVAVIWSAAEGAWTSYVAGADKAEADCEVKNPCVDNAPGGECVQRRRALCPPDPWLSLAKAHLERAHKERVQAERRAGVHVAPRLGAEIPID